VKINPLLPSILKKMFQNSLTLCCHITTTELYNFKILDSVTLKRNLRAPWRWSEEWSKHAGAFL